MRRIPAVVLSLAIAGGLAVPQFSGSAHAVSASKPVIAKAPGGGRGAIALLFKLDLLSTLATACDTTPGALTTALQAGGKSVLAICQATNPGATATGLATTLIAAAKTRLDAAFSAGHLTAAEEARFLSQTQAEIATWLTTPLPAARSESKA